MATPISDPATIAALLRNCSQVCAQAEDMVGQLDAKRNSFLTQNLGDAVQQLDLILRILDEQESGKPKNEARQGLLKRFFARQEGEDAPDGKDFEAPSFDVSRQGLQGNSWSIPLTELLSFLSFGRKTGVLWVDAPGENYLLGISDGTLMHGSSDRTPEGLRIGEVLVGFGFLTRRQLDRFIGTNDEEGQPITGEALLSSGMITSDELHHALVHQVQQLFFRLVGQPNAIFRFREGFEIPHAYQVRLDINQLLLSTAQAQDEVGNPEIRSQVVENDWNSWTSKLSDQVSAKQEETPEQPPKADVKESAKAESKPASAEKAKPAEQAKTPTNAESKADKPKAKGSEEQASQPSKGSDASTKSSKANESPKGDGQKGQKGPKSTNGHQKDGKNAGNSHQGKNGNQNHRNSKNYRNNKNRRNAG